MLNAIPLRQIGQSKPLYQATDDDGAARCASCSLRDLCLPTGLDASDMEKLDGIIHKRKRIARGDLLYRKGDSFGSLYAVRLGHFKTQQVMRNGDMQIMGFQMAGELLGMDAIGNNRHQCDAVALEDSEVCEIPFARLEELFSSLPVLLRHFHRLMSQEITREQTVMMLLGNMMAEQRFAAFLVNLSARYGARGYSMTSFQLRMGREEIGNFLGLTIESISRLIARFKKQQLIQVKSRELDITDLDRLRQVAAGNAALG